MPLGMEVGLGPGDFVRWGLRCSLPKKEAEPPQIFGPCLLWPNGWMDQDCSWHGGRPQPRWLYVRCDGDPAPPKKGGGDPPQFSAHVCCGQTAGRMKAPLGTEVDLGQATLYWMWSQLQLSAKRVQHPPSFLPCLLWPRSPISATAELLLRYMSGQHTDVLITVLCPSQRWSS